MSLLGCMIKRERGQGQRVLEEVTVAMIAKISGSIECSYYWEYMNLRALLF